MRWVWIGGAALLGVAALSTYWAFQSPTFVAGLAALAAGAAWKAIAPAVAKRRTPDDEREMHEAYRGADQGAALERKRRGFPPKG